MNETLLPQASLQFRVTVYADDAPALFAALWSVKAPRRRVSRFRDLAIKGLLFEQMGIQAVAAQLNGSRPATALAQPASLPASRAPMSVSEQLSWGDEP